MLLEKIKSDQVLARKERNKELAILLTTLIGEASMPGKNDGNRVSTDEEVQKVIKKFIKNNLEMIELNKKDLPFVVKMEEEIEILKKYLPKQMTNDELFDAIEQIINSLEEINKSSMGKVLGELRKNHSNFDGKEAAMITRELLAQK